jgi:hypothetical protein
MKKLFILGLSSLLMLSAFAQSEKYLAAMKDKVAAIDTVRNADELLKLAAAFERIGDAEKTQWQPYYYAALATANAGYTLNGDKAPADKTDPLADKADVLIAKAEALSKDNSEIYAVKKMIAYLHFMPDAQSRYMQYSPMATAALQKAQKLNPENPRVYLLQAEDKYFTPEQFGGSKTEAKKLFEQALAKYDAFKPATPVDPVWGRSIAQYFLSQMQ